MAKYNHSKLKNTYLIFEFMIRQLTNELIVETDPNKSKIFEIAKKYFSKGLLKEELALYQAILNNHVPQEYTADKIIEECIRRYSKLNKNKLDKIRYNLIGELKENYNINELFSISIPDYKEAGNVYFLFESIKNDDIVEKSKRRTKLLEHIVKPNNGDKSIRIFESIKKASPKNRELAYLILVDRFNKKYDSVLNEGQRSFVRDYIYNTANQKWVNKHINKIIKEIRSFEKMLTEGNQQDQILGMKVNECVNKMQYIKNKKILNKDDLHKVFLSYQLIEQLDDLNNV